MKKIFGLLTLVVISFTSCNDVSDFLFETDQAVEIRTINNGALYSGGQIIPLSIFSEGTVIPEYYKISIFDEEGLSWGETTITISDPDEEYSSTLVIPEELIPGKYFFYITVYENDIELANHEIIVFKVDDIYSIDELISMPHEVGSGKDVFIHSDITYPESTDPYLRWSVNGDFYSEGYLSQGLDTLYWIAGEDSGLYTISLELFPDQAESTYVSSVKDSVDIIVTDESQVEDYALLPEEYYSLLYHFDGTLNPVDAEDSINAIVGDVGALPSNDSFYYTLSGKSGLSSEREVIPFFQNDLSAFSINGRLAALNPLEPGPVFRVLTDNDTDLQIVLDDTGHLVLDVYGGISRSLFTIFEMTSFSIQIIPQSDAVLVRWFLEGIPAGKDFLEINESIKEPSNQIALIGGDSDTTSAGLILDEFGIFVGGDDRSSVEADQFHRELSKQLGSDLIDADGFDNIENGDPFEAGVKRSISEFSGTLKDLEAVVAFQNFNNDDQWSLVLESESGGEILRFTEKDILQETDSRTSLDFHKIRLKIMGTGDDATLIINNDEETTRSIDFYEPGNKYTLFLETNVENKNDVILDYYVIFTISDSLIPETVATVDEEENLL